MPNNCPVESVVCTNLAVIMARQEALTESQEATHALVQNIHDRIFVDGDALSFQTRTDRLEQLAKAAMGVAIFSVGTVATALVTWIFTK